MSDPEMPGYEQAAANRRAIAAHLVETPLLRLQGPETLTAFGADTEILLKLECLQTTGSFKCRSVLSFVRQLEPARLERGLVTVSAGNHAIAVAYAAKLFGCPAKVLIPKTALARKIELCRRYGAEIVMVDTAQEALDMLERIEIEEGRCFVPAWGDPRLPLGTASIAVELVKQCAAPDAVFVAVGGGSTCAGVAPVVKERWPGCRVFAVEPEGAPTMYRSLRSGVPERLEQVATIADGLAPPLTCPYFLSICRAVVDDLRLVSDAGILTAMQLLFDDAKLAIEPSGAAALAGALGPYREEAAGRRCIVIVSGSNIDPATFAGFLSA